MPARDRVVVHTSTSSTISITHTVAYSASVTFIGFRGTEHVSQPYEFELFFSVPTSADVRKAVGERATLRASRGDWKDPLVLHGVGRGREGVRMRDLAVRVDPLTSQDRQRTTQAALGLGMG